LNGAIIGVPEKSGGYKKGKLKIEIALVVTKNLGFTIQSIPVGIVPYWGSLSQHPFCLTG
jgi:hypothetical protein